MASKREEERNEKIIRGLMKLPPNRRCINCNNLGPQYVCTNFWTFVCMICSGIHREFTHRVKSVSMSKFTSQEVEALQNGGNQRAREIFLKNWDLQRQRLPNTSNVDKVREFIKAVYVDRKYAGGNNSEKPPGDVSQGDIGNETRRASSYHSYSQSPPYDFQYEDRLNRKQGVSLTRKPGSDRGLYERKAASFAYSPGHFTEHLYEDRFANEGSISQVSDYSVSSGGDPFRSAPQSPNLQKDDGFSSPTSDSSREIVDGVQRPTSSTYSEAYAKRDTDRVPVPRPQRTVSSGSFGSSEKNLVFLQSIDSGGLFDVHSQPNQSSAPTQNKVSVSPSPSQLSAEDSGGLNFFTEPLGMPATISAPGVDLFQAPTTGSVASIDLFQSPSHSSTLSQKFHAQTSLSSSASFFSEVSKNASAPNLNEKTPDPSEPSNEGWATFDLPQHSIPSTDTTDSGAHSEGVSSKDVNPVSASNVVLQWPQFESSPVNLPSPLVSYPWTEGLESVFVSTNMPSSQEWKAFEEANDQQHHYMGMQGIDLQVSGDNTSSAADVFLGLKTSEDSGNNELQKIAQSEGFSFPTLPSQVAPGSLFSQSVHPFMSEVANVGNKSGNPFDIPFDSELEASNVEFLNMNTMQAALPSTPVPSPYVNGINESWFPSNPVASQGGMSYMTAQSPSSQLPNAPSHEPVASVGGNPFA